MRQPSEWTRILGTMFGTSGPGGSRKKLIERERQDQIQFAWRSCSSCGYSSCCVSSELIDKDAHRTTRESMRSKVSALAIKLDLCKAPLYDEKWRNRFVRQMKPLGLCWSNPATSISKPWSLEFRPQRTHLHWDT
ncbi:hypothetical protein GQ600_23123 [Phytophthora cactorum]|nr:hypothetical protein GQ600_23123 [Phytophthora cactorum]